MLPITKEGYENLQNKLKEVRIEFEKMPEIIGYARAKGDLKENAEYHAARERQGMLKAEMDKISGDITQGQIIDPKTLPPNTVTFGKIITIKEKSSPDNITYTIVGPAESDIEQNKISVTSQLAKGLLGKKANETVVITVPAGDKTYTILNITV